MKIDLYICYDDNRVINKNKLTFVKTCDCKVYGECDILSPDIVLSFTEEIPSCNYCYIHEFKRFYWITNYSLDSGMRCTITLSCDVLNSWKPYINDLRTIIARSSGRVNGLLPDSTIPIESDTPVKNILSNSSPFTQNNEGCFVLTVLGGGENGN